MDYFLHLLTSLNALFDGIGDAIETAVNCVKDWIRKTNKNNPNASSGRPTWSEVIGHPATGKVAAVVAGIGLISGAYYLLSHTGHAHEEKTDRPLWADRIRQQRHEANGNTISL